MSLIQPIRQGHFPPPLHALAVPLPYLPQGPNDLRYSPIDAYSHRSNTPQSRIHPYLVLNYTQLQPPPLYALLPHPTNRRPEGISSPGP